ncbi:hypothetical protein [Spirillospora sp. CA-294931]|uniref:hypothetical protein n=1 Tax=Spirillospora sp. CA-294931 TaxID=3240042 RepID=UPI003D9472D2
MTGPGRNRGLRKLSPEAKRAVRAAAAEDRDEADVLMRTTRELSADQRATLRSVGATVRTVAGDVSTARVPVGGLEALARLDAEIRRVIRS